MTHRLPLSPPRTMPWLWIPLNMLGMILGSGLAFLAMMGLGLLHDGLRRRLNFPVWLRDESFVYLLSIGLVTGAMLGLLQQWYLGRQGLRLPRWWLVTAGGMILDLFWLAWLWRQNIVAPCGIGLGVMQGGRLPRHVRSWLLWAITSVLGMTLLAVIARWGLVQIFQISEGGRYVFYIFLGIWIVVSGISGGCLHGLLTRPVVKRLVRLHLP